MVDKFTGKPVDKVTDRLPHYNGGRCDTCGAPTVDHCAMCGAPQCCPVCCAASYAEMQLEQERASQSGLAHTHG